MFKYHQGEEYKVEAIQNSKVYTRESKSRHLLGLYYWISWKSFTEEENTWKAVIGI